MDALEAKIRNCCLRLLKYRPRSNKEIEERLKRKKYPADLIRKIIDEFTESGLIDDRAFAKFWLNWRTEINPRSRNFIRLELRQKGLDEAIIKETLQQISSENEFLKATELARRQFQRLKNFEPLKVKRRLYAYLQRRGFEQNVIWDVLNCLFKKESYPDN